MTLGMAQRLRALAKLQDDSHHAAVARDLRDAADELERLTDALGWLQDLCSRNGSVMQNLDDIEQPALRRLDRNLFGGNPPFLTGLCGLPLEPCEAIELVA